MFLQLRRASPYCRTSRKLPRISTSRNRRIVGFKAPCVISPIEFKVAIAVPSSLSSMNAFTWSWNCCEGLKLASATIISYSRAVCLLSLDAVLPDSGLPFWDRGFRTTRHRRSPPDSDGIAHFFAAPQSASPRSSLWYPSSIATTALLNEPASLTRKIWCKGLGPLTDLARDTTSSYLLT